MNWELINVEKIKNKNGKEREYAHLKCKCGALRKAFHTEWIKMLNGTCRSNIGYQCLKCTWEDKQSNPELNAFRRLFVCNRSMAKRSNKEFFITMEDSINLYKSNCFYCNSIPSNLTKGPDGNKYKWTGIDRINSNKGYVKDNVVPCCINCNRAKSNLDQNVFYDLIQKIYTHRVQRLSHSE